MAEHCCQGKHKGPADRARHSQWPRVTVDEARSLVLDAVQVLLVESLSSGDELLGRILASDVVATENVPALHTSIKDGYAVIASDGPGVREVVGVSFPGSPYTRKIKPGQIVRLSTGSPVPAGADAVVMVENTELVEKDDEQEDEEKVEIKVEVSSGQDIRTPGSDISIGQVLIKEGTVIGPIEVGLIAVSNQEKISVYEKPKVAVLSTGSELVTGFVPYLEVGQVRDSNRPQLLALFKSYGAEVFDAGVAGDTREDLISAMDNAFANSSVLVTSGGVSMGERDLLKHVLKDHYQMEILFGRVNVKPGLPCTFAVSTSGPARVVFSLPGNPVSSFVCAHIFAVPFLMKTGGRTKYEHSVLKVKLDGSVKLGDRPEFRPAIMRFTEEGPVACVTGDLCSSRLPVLARANILLKLPAKDDNLQVMDEGATVDSLVISSL